MNVAKVNLVRKSISHWGMHLVDFYWIGWLQIPAATSAYPFSAMGEWGGPDDLR